MSDPPSGSGGVELATEHLLAAARDRTPCPPVRDLLAANNLATGYAVQGQLIEAGLAAGRQVVGRKIGLTSVAVQRQLGVDQPDFGVLFDDMECRQDEPLSFNRLLQPRIEAEIAFVLSADLDSGSITGTAARAAVDHVTAALEIVDSRIAGWDISLVDTVADNASSGLFVLGSEHVAPGGRDLTEVQMTLRDDHGQQLSTGTGRDCLGDPVAALVWLARTARELGSPLRAGDVVLSGALGPMVPVCPGQQYTADLSGLGSVCAVFEREETV